MGATLQYARKVGGSLMVTIPREVAEIEQISPGEVVEVVIHRVRKDWFGALRGLKPLKKEEKLNIHD